jgi:hypothetical protein
MHFGPGSAALHLTFLRIFQKHVHTETIHPSLVIDDPVVDVHLAEVAVVMLAAQPLTGLRHPRDVQVTPREKVLVGPTLTVEPGTANAAPYTLFILRQLFVVSYVN